MACSHFLFYMPLSIIVEITMKEMNILPYGMIIHFLHAIYLLN